MLDIAPAATGVKSRTNDRLDSPTYHGDDDVRAGQEAWQRLRSNATWEDWKQVGKAHVIGRAAAMREAHVNRPTGRRYNECFGAWQRKFGFENLDKGDRARLFEVMDRLAEIEDWLATLTTTERLRLNHPSSITRRWKALTVIPNPDATPRPSPYAQLREAHNLLIEDHHRLESEIKTGGGDLWTAQDTAADIAQVMVRKLSAHKAEQVARAMLVKLKDERPAKKLRACSPALEERHAD
jgi:hypothetical protein